MSFMPKNLRQHNTGKDDKKNGRDKIYKYTEVASF